MGSDWTPAAFLGDRVRLSLIEFMSICLSRAAPRLQQLKKDGDETHYLAVP
jgi:hypothetical protein